MCAYGQEDPSGPVYLVDGDPEVARSVPLLLRDLDLDTKVFGSAGVALARIRLRSPSCLISEADLPEMSGIELLRVLRNRGAHFPVIIMANHPDVPLAVEAMRLGAVDVIEKPLVDSVLLERVREAVAGFSVAARGE